MENDFAVVVVALFMGFAFVGFIMVCLLIGEFVEGMFRTLSKVGNSLDRWYEEL